MAVDAPLNYFTSCHGETHGLPTKSHILKFLILLGIHLWYQSEAFIRLASFDSRVSSDSKCFTIADIEEVSPHYLSEKPSVKSNACLCAKSLEQFCTTPRNCFRSLYAKTACMKWCLPEVLLLWKMTKHLEKQMCLYKELAVVNDRVDCGFAFIQDFNE